jgi:arsenate reductase-like glutaredoxin family protein
MNIVIFINPKCIPTKKLSDTVDQFLIPHSVIIILHPLNRYSADSISGTLDA